MPTDLAEPLTLVCGTSDAYAMPTTVMLHSAIKNLEAGTSAEVWIIDHGMHPATKSRVLDCIGSLSRNVLVQVVDPPETQLKNLDSNAVSPVVFDRFGLTQLLPVQTQRAIFLDSDLIVQGNLRDLWAMDFDGNAILAVQDFYFDKLEPRMRRLDDARADGIDPDTPYVNGGVLVCDLAHWRENDVESSLIRDLLQHAHGYGFPDQDATNIMMSDRIKLLPSEWNVQANAVDRTREATITKAAVNLSLRGWDQAKIIHYAGAIKPWSTMRVREPLGTAHKRFHLRLRETKWLKAGAYQRYINGLRADWVWRHMRTGFDRRRTRRNRPNPS